MAELRLQVPSDGPRARLPVDACNTPADGAAPPCAAHASVAAHPFPRCNISTIVFGYAGQQRVTLQRRRPPASRRHAGARRILWQKKSSQRAHHAEMCVVLQPAPAAKRGMMPECRRQQPGPPLAGPGHPVAMHASRASVRAPRGKCLRRNASRYRASRSECNTQQVVAVAVMSSRKDIPVLRSKRLLSADAGNPVLVAEAPPWRILCACDGFFAAMLTARAPPPD